MTRYLAARRPSVDSAGRASNQSPPADSFFCFKVSSHAPTPAVALVEVRLGLGTMVLPFLWPYRKQFTGVQWWQLAGIGVINSAIPFALYAWAAQCAPTGIGSITNAMTVMFTALVAFFLYGELIGTLRGIGLLLGFIGVAVSTVTYLIPLFGVIWAWIIIGEPISINVTLADTLILGGVALSQQRTR